MEVCLTSVFSGKARYSLLVLTNTRQHFSTVFGSKITNKNKKNGTKDIAKRILVYSMGAETRKQQVASTMSAGDSDFCSSH